MVNFWQRVKEAVQVLRGDTDIHAIKENESTLKKQVAELNGQVTELNGQVAELSDRVADAKRTLKKQAATHLDRQGKEEARNYELNQKIKSLSRKAVQIEKPGNVNSTRELAKMVETVLNYDNIARFHKEPGPSPVLVPETIEKLLFQGKADISRRINTYERIHTPHASQDYTAPICEGLYAACLNHATESWAKPVLSSLLKAMPKAKAEELILVSNPKMDINKLKLLDSIFSDRSIFDPKTMDLENIVSFDSGGGERFAKNSYDSNLISLLHKNGFLTDENPTVKFLRKSLPFYESTSPENKESRPYPLLPGTPEGIPFPIEVLCNPQENFKDLQKSFQKRTKEGHDKIVSAKSPRDKQNAMARYSDLRKEQEFFYVLTGQELWSDLPFQQTQTKTKSKSKPGGKDGR